MRSSLPAALFRLVRLLYFMAPAYAANMAPPFVRYWRGWNRPISEPWLGSHKTIVGFGAGVLAAIAVTYAQSRIAWDGALLSYEHWPYDHWPYEHWIVLGLRFGVGAMVGDSAKSLVKRRVGVPPGTSWRPWDQVDFVLGALLFVWGTAALTWIDVTAILAMSVAGHILVNRVGYWIGVRDVSW